MHTLSTPHGLLTLPIFLPDATRGFIRSLSMRDAASAGIGPMVVNTLHLYLQPGLDVIRSFGGVHAFMRTTVPLVSDSGGYQVYSLIHTKKGRGSITEQGATFRSPLDGSAHELTPEKSIQIQFELGTDIMICLDDCPPHDAGYTTIERAVERTIAWAQRSRKEFERHVIARRLTEATRPLLCAVIQGGQYPELRRQCADALKSIGFDGYGYGARPVDDQGIFLRDILALTASSIPDSAFRFALGVGSPADIVACSRMGWQLFDCVIPTREARHGRLYRFNGTGISDEFSEDTFYEVINILNATYRLDQRPVDERCPCEMCQSLSRGYVHHLFKANESASWRLATIHNLTFYTTLIAKLREHRN